MTAEHKTNRFGSHYTYYHCSWRRLDYKCTQRSITEEQLEAQMAQFVEETALPDKFHGFEMERLQGLKAEDQELVTKQRQALETRAAALDRQLVNLKKLRIRDLLDDEEFLHERQELTRERLQVMQEIEKLGENMERFERVRLLVEFSKVAVPRFKAGTPQEKRFILQILGSNPRLQDRELKIDAAKPFRRWSKTPTSGDLRAFLQEVRTFLDGPDYRERLENVRKLMEMGKELREENKAA